MPAAGLRSWRRPADAEEEMNVETRFCAARPGVGPDPGPSPRGHCAAAGFARTRTAQHRADDRGSRTTGGNPRHAGGDVHLGCPISTVGSFPADRSSRLRSPNVQWQIRALQTDRLG